MAEPESPIPKPVADYIVRDPEAFAKNMAKAAEAIGKAASAWLAPRERGEVVDELSPTAADMVETFNRVALHWLSDPKLVLNAQTRLMTQGFRVWSESMNRVLAGASEEKASDRRFADEDWNSNPFFDFLRRAYQATVEVGTEFVLDADDLDERTRQKARFYVEQLAAAIAPSNFLVTNPEALKRTVATNGQNLAEGFQMLAEDLERGRGSLKLRQADSTNFELGRNIAITPGRVVARNALCEVIQYEAQTEQVLRRPLVIVPPWINKFYILDLNAEKSFIDWAVKQGHTVFVISWAQPDERHAELDWADYARDGIEFALNTAEKATGERTSNTIGYCVGGTLLAATLALHAKRDDDRVRSVTLFTTQVDFEHAGDLKVFVDEEQLSALEAKMKRKGYLDGGEMATAFNMLRARDLIWSTVVNNYMLGKTPPAFDLLHWNSDSTRMSAANHSYYLRNCYLNNALTSGQMVLDGETLELSAVTIPLYNLATREDHIAPAKSVYEGSKAFGGPVTYVMSGSGHIAGVVNPPAKKKYQFWTGPDPSDEIPFEDWVTNAEETPGSWWDHWQAWIEALDDERVPARPIGGDALEAMEPAPGLYVRVKA